MTMLHAHTRRRVRNDQERAKDAMTTQKQVALTGLCPGPVEIKARIFIYLHPMRPRDKCLELFVTVVKVCLLFCTLFAFLKLDLI